jgi:DNA-binding GntR family transcriptional regulator
MTKQDVVEYVKDAIIRGKIAPGEKIVEARLCRDLNVGRSHVREALRHLEQEEFIEIFPYAGAVVKELSQKDVAQIYDIMGALEGLSMRIAAPNISDEEIEKIDSLADAMEENQDNKFKLFYANFEFHQHLTALGGNTRLIAFMNRIREQTHRMGLQSFYNPEQVQASMIEHREIVNAIKERDPVKVEALIRNHYLTSKNRLIRYINNTL